MAKNKRIKIAQWELGHKLNKENLDFWGQVKFIKDGIKYIGFKCDFRRVTKEEIQKVFPQVTFMMSSSQYAPEIKNSVVAFPRNTQLYMIEMG